MKSNTVAAIGWVNFVLCSEIFLSFVIWIYLFVWLIVCLFVCLFVCFTLFAFLCLLSYSFVCMYAGMYVESLKKQTCLCKSKCMCVCNIFSKMIEKIHKWNFLLQVKTLYFFVVVCWHVVVVVCSRKKSFVFISLWTKNMWYCCNKWLFIITINNTNVFNMSLIPSHWSIHFCYFESLWGLTRPAQYPSSI
jgi:hypothetical protein